MAKRVQDANPAQNQSQTQTKSLYVTVCTFDKGGKTIGTRVVDMYHYGTRNWMQNHLWWAMHNSCVIETQVSTEDEVAEYVKVGSQALQEAFA
jgi:hypothetical protein